ncbi:hypothetical protein [Cellulosilyticum ruminicola]|uniref:hypothetical protein n=1 Tax=Cellulosilyticum ruminicola TaxID=425254 RepID=UPI0012EDA29D|nr:hypothetical protein [Cellulosilyticum ruminicola]
MKNNKFLFKEIVLEDAKEINGGVSLSVFPFESKIPTRPTGLIAPPITTFSIKDITVAN